MTAQPEWRPAREIQFQFHPRPLTGGNRQRFNMMPIAARLFSRTGIREKFSLLRHGGVHVGNIAGPGRDRNESHFRKRK